VCTSVFLQVETAFFDPNAFHLRHGRPDRILDGFMGSIQELYLFSVRWLILQTPRPLASRLASFLKSRPLFSPGNLISSESEEGALVMFPFAFTLNRANADRVAWQPSLVYPTLHPPRHFSEGRW
jgi:hypothetical protein